MNTIKTKIGFDTKPYIMNAIKFYALFDIPFKVYGQILLLLATLLSIGNWSCLKSIKSKQTTRLYLLQQESVTLDRRYEQLVAQYDALSSLKRLNDIAQTIGMQKPSPQETIYNTQYNHIKS